MRLKRALLGVSVFLIAVTAGAQPVIDQEQVALGTLDFAVGGSSKQKLAQVFQAGRSGYLTEVTLPIGCTAGAVLNVSVQETIGGSPSGVILTSELVSGATLPPPVTGALRIIEFCDPAFVVATKRYALTLEVMNPSTDSCGTIVGPEGDTYTAGLGYFDALPNPPGWIANIPEVDLVFQTYVDSSKKVCCGKKPKK